VDQRAELHNASMSWVDRLRAVLDDDLTARTKLLIKIPQSRAAHS
jgi:hypothetical protein